MVMQSAGNGASNGIVSVDFDSVGIAVGLRSACPPPLGPRRSQPVQVETILFTMPNSPSRFRPTLVPTHLPVDGARVIGRRHFVCRGARYPWVDGR